MKINGEALRWGPLTALVALRQGWRFVAFTAAGPAALLAAHLLPPSGPGLALRLAGAAVCVLLLPGALLLRAVAWPSAPAIALTASFALSLAVVSFALALVFAVGASILLAIGVLAVVSACAFVRAVLNGRSDPVPRAERRTLTAVLAAAVPLAGIVWWAAGPVWGDGFFHVARARKLTEFDTLSTLTTVAEFKDGGLHPGYAFPLWHAVDALVARLAGVDVLDVVVYLPAILVPLAFVLAYAAGSVVFGSRAGGLAFVAAQVAYLGFSRRGGTTLVGTGQFENLAQPHAASLVLLAPAVLALTFAFAAEGRWILLVALGTAAFALTAVHPTYTSYVALVVGGLIVARVVLTRAWEPSLTRITLGLATIVAPFALYLALLFPTIAATESRTPSADDRAMELERYGGGFTALGGWIGLAPDWIARPGGVVVAGLLAVPLAGFAARRLWAALVLGGSLAVLTVMLLPPLFTALSDAFSLAQARRLAQFLPIAFAVAGGCIVLSRFRVVGLALAGASGLAIVLLFPGEFTPEFEKGGPGWTVWVAVAGGFVALAAGLLLRPLGPSPSQWTAAAAAAFVVPVAIAGLSGVTRGGPESKLTPGIVAAVRASAAPGDVVFSDEVAAYEIAAFAPVYVNAARRGNVADIPRNREDARVDDVRRFFVRDSTEDRERRAILGRYTADWVLVDKKLRHPEDFLRQLQLLYQDERFALYRTRS